MKISKLRRALAVLLSAAMLIMCMPTVGITAAAATEISEIEVSIDFDQIAVTATAGNAIPLASSRIEGGSGDGKILNIKTTKLAYAYGWAVYENGSWKPLAGSGNEFSNDATYGLFFDSIPYSDEGYAFSSAIEFKGIDSNKLVSLVNNSTEIFYVYNLGTIEEMQNMHEPTEVAYTDLVNKTVTKLYVGDKIVISLSGVSNYAINFAWKDSTDYITKSDMMGGYSQKSYEVPETYTYLKESRTASSYWTVAEASLSNYHLSIKLQSDTADPAAADDGTIKLLEGVTLTPTDDTCTQYKISGLPSGDYEYYYYLYHDRTACGIYNTLYEDYDHYIGKSTDEVEVNVNDMKAVKNGDTITFAEDANNCPPFGMVRLYQVKTGGSDISKNLCAYEGYFVCPLGHTVDIGKKIEAIDKDSVTLTPNADKTEYTVTLPELEDGYIYLYQAWPFESEEPISDAELASIKNEMWEYVNFYSGKAVGYCTANPIYSKELKSGDKITVNDYTELDIYKVRKNTSTDDYYDYFSVDNDQSYKVYALYIDVIGTYAEPNTISELNFSGADKITLVDGKALPTIDEVKKILTVTGKYTNGTSFDGEITIAVWADSDTGDFYNEGDIADIEKEYELILRVVPKGAEEFSGIYGMKINGGFRLYEAYENRGVDVGSLENYIPKSAEPDEPIEEGDIIIDNSDNYSGAGVANAEEAKSVIPVTDDEKAAIESGENFYIILDVKDGNATVPTTDRTAVNTIANENGLTVGMMLDIELFKRIGENGSDVRITETNGLLTVEFTMPAELLSTDSTVTRTYKIIRVHNGVTDILDCDFDPATGKASFKTNMFSTYAIAYVDVPVAEPQTPVTKYPLNLGTDGRVHANANSAAAGDKITITVDAGYIAHVYSGTTEIARISGTGSFIMPANGVKIVVECELGQYMLTKARSYVYSYDSGMNYITVNATKNQKSTVTINLGKDYAGKSFTVYEGKKSTSVKVTEGTLDNNGKFTLEVDYGKNYTLVVED